MTGGKHEFWKIETRIFSSAGLDSESDIERIEEISVLAHALAMRFDRSKAPEAGSPLSRTPADSPDGSARMMLDVVPNDWNNADNPQ
ncbi:MULTISPECIES: hypothetical protein [unclassified Bradyrhizobium]|uniref:hypothetical protein n=1 Tax=unclassified Bradyrhizobium TaxID=2631580 RepID=UPI002915F1E6|nr:MULTISPECIES: hypothetical protein [unclassified Bradyrhizobium]